MSGKRSGLSVKDKICILEKYDALPKMSQREAATALNIPRTTLSKILKSREDLKARMRSVASVNHNRKRIRSGKNKAVEDALKMWFVAARASNVPINGPILRQKAKDFGKEMGFDDFTASEGWLDRWKKRENIVYHLQKTHQLESKDSNPETTAQNWIKEEWPRVAGRFRPQDIYSADETGLYFRAMPKNIWGGWKKCRVAMERITVLCCVSMTGEKKQLLVVGRSKRLKCFQEVSCLPTHYETNDNAWMTCTIFTDWLNAWDAELGREQRNICLLVDNCTAHSPNVQLSNIKIVIIPPLIHPCGRGIIVNLKMLYRSEMRSEIEKRFDDNDNDAITGCDIAKTITLLDALHMLAKCWRLVSSISIQNCFCHALFTEKPKQKDEMEVDGIHVVTVPVGMTKREFNDWVALDEGIPVASFLNVSDLSIVDKVQKNGKTAENSEESEQEEDDPGPTPTAKHMRAALRTIRIGLERRGFSDFESYYRFEDLVSGALAEASQVNSKEPDIDGIHVSSDMPGLVYLLQMTSQPMNTPNNHH